MSRQPTSRPSGEHLTTLTRIFRQVGLDEKMHDERRKKILKHLSAAIGELQAEIGK